MRLKELRLKKGLTQKELAKRLKISNSAVGMYEQGQRQPNHETIKAIADLFDVTIDYLLERETSKEADLIDAERQQKITKLTELFDKMTPEQQELLISLAENMRGAK